MPDSPAATDRRRAPIAAGGPLFLAWMLAGAGIALGVLSLFSIGVVVLPAALVVTVALSIWPRSRNRSAAGLVTGAGLLPLYVAFLNRDGPGTVCVTTATSQSCVDEWSPWPWFAAGLALVLAGLALAAILGRKAN